MHGASVGRSLSYGKTPWTRGLASGSALGSGVSRRLAPLSRRRSFERLLGWHDGSAGRSLSYGKTPWTRGFASGSALGSGVSRRLAPLSRRRSFKRLLILRSGSPSYRRSGWISLEGTVGEDLYFRYLDIDGNGTLDLLDFAAVRLAFGSREVTKNFCQGSTPIVMVKLTCSTFAGSGISSVAEPGASATPSRAD